MSMRVVRFGYIGQFYRKIHRVKFKHLRVGFTVFKPVLSDVYLALSGLGWLEGSSVEAGRRVLRRLLRKRGYVFIKIFCYWPVTKKSAHSRMGGGKGGVCKFIYPLVSGKLVYELFDYYRLKVLFREWFFRIFCGILYDFVDKRRWRVYLLRKWQYYCFVRVLSKFGFFPKVQRYLY